MLSRLSVRDLALVADAAVEFGPGLNVVTGETGAGKSLLIGAVGLALGERASAELVRAGAERARVEAAFEMDSPERLNARLRELGLGEMEDGWLILRREIRADGRSRAFVGEEQVLVSTLRSLGESLVDFHGQGEGQALLRPATQRGCLDIVAGTREDIARLAEILGEEAALSGQIDEVRRRHEEIARQREYFEHQLREIDAAELSPGEENELRRERRMLLGAAQLGERVGTLARELTDDEGAALSRIDRALDALGELTEIDPDLVPVRAMLESARLEVEEVARTVAGRVKDLDFRPERRDEVEARLDLIASLKRKYGADEEAVLAHAATLRSALNDSEAGGLEIRELETERGRAREAAGISADRITVKRRKVSRRLARSVEKELPELGMDGAKFEVRLGVQPDPESWYEREGTAIKLGAHGSETVDFLLSANPGEPGGLIGKVASGGELSRVMLALKVVLADAEAEAVATMIFDEVDSGIGGRTARAVAERIARLAGDRQIIAITHLASVACAGDRHYRIEKTSGKGRSRVLVDLLDDETRVDEIARMLSGGEGDATAREHARELLGTIPRSGASA